jgi:hypothetical protein
MLTERLPRFECLGHERMPHLVRNGTSRSIPRDVPRKGNYLLFWQARVTRKGGLRGGAVNESARNFWQ